MAGWLTVMVIARIPPTPGRRYGNRALPTYGRQATILQRASVLVRNCLGKEVCW